ncbi:MAG: DoxX family membrane protein [Actinomycetia bacterium]|nr:DoxX family membrane protein [Actinomycetes bacterium]
MSKRRVESGPRSRRRWVAAGVAGLVLVEARPAAAHVKWFSDFDFADAPRTLSEIITPTFVSMTLASVVTIVAMVFVDRRLASVPWYAAISTWLSDREGFSGAVMRFAIAAVLIVSWENQALLAPELAEPAAWVGWLQFAIALLILFPRAGLVGGVGIVLLWLIGVADNGAFHMLDYLHYLGIGIYLAARDPRSSAMRWIGLPALYASVGGALIWAAFEKLVYPGWSMFILEEHPQLVLGVSPDLFLQIAAFVEISLGFLLIIGLVERPLAAVITLVFFSSTLVFGRTEIVGHAPLHAALVVFLLAGPGGVWPSPIRGPETIDWRSGLDVLSSVSTNFALTLVAFGAAYLASASAQFEDAATSPEQPLAFAVDISTAPQIAAIDVVVDESGPERLVISTRNWTFAPSSIGAPTVPNEGYGVVLVDGDDAGRLYGNWLDLGDLTPGDHVVSVSLYGSDERVFTVDDEPIVAQLLVSVS